MNTESTGKGLTRKEVLKLGLLGSAALALPLERAARTQQAVVNRLPASRLPKPFQVPFARPPVLRPVRRSATTDFYRITQKAARVQILPGDFGKTLIYGYNGITPGPAIVANQGRKTVVRQINRLPRRHPTLGYPSLTSTHLHGSASLPQYDGYASDETRPGQFKDYVYPNFQNARSIWYHDHGVHHTQEDVYYGLAGPYIIHDPLELALPIPHGRYDVPLIIQDKIFSRSGDFVFDDRDHSGLMGDVMLVNGRPWPVMKVERRKYRFRILNGSVGRSLRLALDSGEPMTIIGHDGGLAPRPVDVNRFRMIMAERYEVVIDFAKYRVGEQVRMLNLSNENNVDFPSTRNIMRFDVVSNATDTSNNTVPPVLFPNREIMGLATPRDLTRGADTTLQLVRRNGLWTVNGETWADVENSNFRRVVANPRLNEVRVWDLVNKSNGWHHPLHVHLVDFEILGRLEGGGRLIPPLPHERGPKDVVYLGEGETVRIISRFGPQRGRYMVHCHNLAHEDHDMMVQFEVGTGGPDPVTSAPAKPISQMTPL